MIDTPPFEMIIETEMEQYRHDTWATKEPETIAWIDSFHPGAVFFDIGANIGIYSLYCAKKHPRSHVISVEPHTPNHDRLLENMMLNNLKNMQIYEYAIGARCRTETFYANTVEIGTSGGQLAEAKDENGDKFNPVFEERVLCVTLDFLSCITMQPSYIKIDIDGQEDRVLCGGVQTLASPVLHSVLIEVTPASNRKETVRLFELLGFTKQNIFNAMADHSSVRRQREGIKAENIIFTRR